MKQQMYAETADIETASEDYAARFSGVAGEFFLARQTEITLSLLRDQQGGRILDVGGGHAQLAEPLVKNGFAVTVTGSEESCRDRLDRCLGPGDFEYQTCDSLALPFADRAFDVVMAFRLLPHVSRWQELLAELCRVADKCLILDYPDKRSANVLYQQFFGMKKKMEGNTRPFTLFSRAQIGAEMEKNGFQSPSFLPQFFLPMVVHRKVNNATFSTLAEKGCALCGATRFWGSPIIFRADRLVR